MAELQQCYNRNCGQKFDPSINKEDSCTFHAGEPFFHDAYKGWNCCGKKATDFTEFLNFKGCTKGPHNPVKPPEPEKKKEQVIIEEVVQAPRAPKPKGPAPRSLGESQRVDLKKIISASAKANMEKWAEEKNGGGDDDKGSSDSDPQVVEIGTVCKNNACSCAYRGELSNSEDCYSHPGYPVFHEGMKYWSCCSRKTTDFDNFMNQQGCTKGNHKWIEEKKENEERDLDCRKDFHQTPTQVILTIYAKNCDPVESKVTANGVLLSIFIKDKDSKVLQSDIALWGEIIPDESSVSFTPNKVEVKLKKAESFSWSNYEHWE